MTTRNNGEQQSNVSAVEDTNYKPQRKHKVRILLLIQCFFVSPVKNAVMYFSFNEAKAAENSDGLIPDKSGHFNDATVSNRAHISSRTYGK